MKFVDQYEDSSFSDPERDIPNKRVIHLDNGRHITLERRDPFGFVYVVWDRGPVPVALSGTYTTFPLATQAVTLWVSNNTFSEAVEAPVEKTPPLKYKKAYRDPETGENLPVNG